MSRKSSRQPIEHIALELLSDPTDAGPLGSKDELSLRRDIEWILNAVREKELRAHKRETAHASGIPRSLIVAMCAGILLVIGATVGIATWISRETPRNTPRELAEVSFDVKRSTTPALANRNPEPRVVATQKIATMEIPSTTSVSDDVRVLVMPHSVVHLDPVSAQNRRLTLERGRVVVSVTKGRANGFSVLTRLGQVLVTGTRFAVEQNDQRACVQVEEGLVVMRGADSDVPLAAGKRACFEDEQPQSLAPEERAALRSELTRLERDFAREPQREKISPDETHEESTDSSSEQPVLLGRAREAVSREAYGLAASLYEELIEKEGPSQLGLFSKVTLGKIYLYRLDRPADALEKFEAYLRQDSSGTLAAEAHYAALQAEKQLGNLEAACRRRELIASVYPLSPQGRLAKEELAKSCPSGMSRLEKTAP